MIGKLLRAELLKIKRKNFWLLVFIGPLGVVGLQMVNYGVRKQYLLSRSDDAWGYYLQNLSGFTPLALVLGIAILTSFIASIENESNAWKQLLALPVSKLSVYLAKFTILAGLLLLSSFILMIAGLAHGLSLNFGDKVPIAALIQYSFFPYLAALPILALHLWIATVSHNQAIPMTLGIISFILTYSAYFLPDWMIWKWPTLLNEWDKPYLNALLGVGVGSALYIVGMLDFNRRDVK